MSDDLLEQQKAYYRARAAEYDEWWLREGLHDRGQEFRQRWEADKAELASVVGAFDARGQVLELAAGTGNFTRELVRTADRVTAVDASAETLAIATAKVDAVEGACPLDVVVADVFEWRPSRRYDVVFFSFWLSHVPADRFDEFWQLVADCLGPGGRVLFIDNTQGSDSATVRHDGLSQRTLKDGSSFTIVKRFWEPAALAADLAELGWAADVSTTSEFFLHGSAVRDD